MSGLLASKWANAEAISEPEKPSKAPTPAPKPQAGNGLLRSKWANAPDDPEHPINAKAPVSSPKKPEASGRVDRQAKKQSPKSNAPPKQHAPKQRGNVGDLANSLAKVDLSKGRKSAPKNQKHSPAVHNQAPRKLSRGSDSEDEREPMTDAGNVFAARLGLSAPKESHKSQGIKPHPEAASRPKASTEEPPRKYLTPKQKKLNEEKLKREELSRAQAEKDAKLKAEVQSLFEKMSDKSTSWADLEDE